jgi:hypothetical protein
MTMECSELSNTSSSFLETEDTQSIRETLYRVLLTSGLREAEMIEYLSFLDGNYRYVDDISQLRKGCFTRWLGEKHKKLVYGGFVLNFEPKDTGSILVTCKNIRGSIFVYDFNSAITFQKLTIMDKTILSFNSEKDA